MPAGRFESIWTYLDCVEETIYSRLGTIPIRRCISTLLGLSNRVYGLDRRAGRAAQMTGFLNGQSTAYVQRAACATRGGRLREIGKALRLPILWRGFLFRCRDYKTLRSDVVVPGPGETSKLPLEPFVFRSGRKHILINQGMACWNRNGSYLTPSGSGTNSKAISGLGTDRLFAQSNEQR